jgi:type I restriction enzyme S subunit
MKFIVKKQSELVAKTRWDADFHIPPELIKKYPKECLTPISNLADVVKTKKDPTSTPEVEFDYIDIASLNNLLGEIIRETTLMGNEAPSRARKLVRSGDIIVSTCRPTRGAIAIIPKHLDLQICSTAFTVLRPKEGVNPSVLHYLLRLDSTSEQFRKWSSGSSYPAILDTDVMKTLVPFGFNDEEKQLKFEKILLNAIEEFKTKVNAAENAFSKKIETLNSKLM